MAATKAMAVTRRGQRGLSLIGFLLVAAVVLIFALIAFRMVPAYIEWYTVQKALDTTMRDTSDPTLANIRRSMERKLNADYTDAVYAKDVEVTRNGNTVTASVSWQKKLPLVSNVSLVIDFDASASR
jgi:Tfp pilus assembly protein PilE